MDQRTAGEVTASPLRCLKFARNKRGRICGLEVADVELKMCERHAREEREYRRLAQREDYGGHGISLEYRAIDGDLRDDPFYYVTDHLQIADCGKHGTPRRAREEIDRCNADRFAGCNAYIPAPPPTDIQWDKFTHSTDGVHR